MTDTLELFVKNPLAFVSLMSAIIAASVAVIVFVLTQYLTQKKERTQFLTPKLEELYLLLNEVSENNVTFVKLTYLSLEGDAQAREEIDAMDDLDLHGHRTAKRIIMNIRLYFPLLSHIHQLLFAAQRDLNELMFELHSKSPPDFLDVMNAGGRVGHFLMLMEEEVIRNRDQLLADHFFPKRYKQTTQAALEAEIPPPCGPFMIFPENQD